MKGVQAQGTKAAKGVKSVHGRMLIYRASGSGNFVFVGYLVRYEGYLRALGVEALTPYVLLPVEFHHTGRPVLGTSWNRSTLPECCLKP